MVVKKDKAHVSNSIGQVFTPDYVAKFMIKNALSFLEGQKLKALEPSVGKGVFLKFLIQEGLENIHAYEIDENLKKFLVERYPNINFKFKNFLGSNESEKYDLIIGNPPYLGQNYNAQVFQEYVRKFPICAEYFVGNMDLFYFFIHKAIVKLKPGGILSFITTNYWITKSKKTGIKLLKPHVLSECFLRQYIDLSNLKMFQGAKGQHNCIFILQKKSEKEKRQNTNRSLEILKITKKTEHNQLDSEYNEKVFKNLMEGFLTKHVIKYKSAVTNKDLNPEGSWNLLYPGEVKKVVDKIEKYCSRNNRVTFLKDKFVVRNGIIFIKDDIFVLSEENNLKIKDDEISIQINGKYHSLSQKEKERLKIIHKSKSIKPYGHDPELPIKRAIFFNKNQFISRTESVRNERFENEYPLLTAYLKQFESDLKHILVNAKENPCDMFFPRRGAFIRDLKKVNDKIVKNLTDLEPLYDSAKKIFFKFISNDNIFGYADTSYYATSDTYFLWPKVPEKELDYPFLLAYLNSKLVRFLFKAKNIKIKRSKTKLEEELPLPNKKMLHSEKNHLNIGLITILSSMLIELNNPTSNLAIQGFINKLHKIEHEIKDAKDEILSSLYSAIERKDGNFVQKTIDHLIFQLFNLREKEIDYLINKYYHL